MTPAFRRFLPIVLLPLLAAPVARADDRSNAAYWYQRAIDALAEAELTDAESLALGEYSGEGGPPPPEVVRALDRVQPALQALERGAARPESDWNHDYSQGFDLLLPHLRELRSLTRVAGADLNRKLDAGDSAGAAARAAALYQAGGHLGSDRIMISSLVGQAVFAHADASVQYAIDHGTFTPSDAALLLQTTDRLDPQDPFNYVESMVMEHEIMVTWLDQRLGTEEGIRTFMEDFGYDDAATRQVLDEVTQDEVDAEIERLDGFMTQMLDAFTTDDPEVARDEFDRLTEELRGGEHGRLAYLVVPAYDRLYERMIESREMLASRRETLKKLAGGEAEPADLVNAATIYLAAMKRWSELTDAQRDAIAEVRRADPDTAVPPEAAAALRDAQPVLALIRDASSYERCDFEREHRREGNDFIPGYIAGMHDLWTLVIAEARHAADQEDAERLADRLALGLHMVGHFNEPRHTLGSLVAHHAFTELLRVGADLTVTELPEDDVVFLRRGFKRIDIADPFGYLRSRDAVRDALDWALVHWGRQFQEGDHMNRAVVTRLLRAADGDRLLFYLTLASHDFADWAPSRYITEEGTVKRFVPPLEAPQAERLDALGEILDLGAVEQVALMTSDLGTRIRAEGMSALAEVDVPPLARTAQYMQRARPDVRTMRVLLYPGFQTGDQAAAPENAEGTEGAGETEEPAYTTTGASTPDGVNDRQ